MRACGATVRRRVAGGFLGLLALLAVVAPVAALAAPAAPVAGAASATSASSWRATLIGASLHGGATTLLQSNGRGSVNVKVFGVPAGQGAVASVVGARCGSAGDRVASFPLRVDGDGTATGRLQLTPAQVSAYGAARHAGVLLSVRVATTGDEACGNQSGAPSVGTTRLAATEAGLFSYDIRVPRVGGLPPEIASLVNAELQGAAEATIAEFVQSARAAGAPPGFRNTAWQTFTVSFAQPSLLSVVEHYVPDVFGAPHGDEHFFTFTFDLATGRRILLADLFRPDTPWLAALSREAIARLTPRLGAFASALAGPIADSFQAWRLMPGGLAITFDQAQGFAVPITTITIPWAALGGVLDRTSPIARLLPPP